MRGKWIETDALGGFCLLIRREVLERIRPALAKWTDLSLFDTDIAGKKARQEGFKLVVCRGRQLGRAPAKSTRVHFVHFRTGCVLL